jgi:hypothetical protein
LAALVLTLSFALAGCAASDQDSKESASPSPKGTVTVSPSLPPPAGQPSFSPKPKPKPNPNPKPTGKPGRAVVTVRGTVSTGVEAGCLMLTANGTAYQLVGGDRSALRAGRTVEVVGEVQPELATTCQQGTPLLVRQIKIG